MPKYINPELILKKLGSYENDDDAVISVADLKRMITRAESSGVDVIYCARCKFANRRTDEFGNLEYRCPKRANYLVDPTDFCGKGVDRYK